MNKDNPSDTCGASSPVKGALFSALDIERRGLISGKYNLPYNPKLAEKAKMLRGNMTRAERKIWFDCLKNSSFKFYRQRMIDHYIVDFYCSSQRLIIEIDGSQHYTEDGIECDEIRTEILNAYDLSVLRFTNEDILNKFDLSCKIIETKLNRKQPPITGEVSRSDGGVT